MVRKFVHAALHGMKDMMDDPDKAADDFVKFVPEWKGKEGAVKSCVQLLRQAGLSGPDSSSARSMPSGSPSCRTSIWPRASSRRRRRSRNFTRNEFIK